MFWGELSLFGVKIMTFKLWDSLDDDDYDDDDETQDDRYGRDDDGK